MDAMEFPGFLSRLAESRISPVTVAVGADQLAEIAVTIR